MPPSRPVPEVWEDWQSGHQPECEITTSFTVLCPFFPWLELWPQIAVILLTAAQPLHDRLHAHGKSVKIRWVARFDDDETHISFQLQRRGSFWGALASFRMGFCRLLVEDLAF